MIRYGRQNTFDASNLEANKMKPQHPLDCSHQLLTIEIQTGLSGPALYHRSLLKGLLTLITYQHTNNIVYAPSDGVFVRHVLNFIQELATEDGGSDYSQLKAALGITEQNGGGKTIESLLTNGI